MKQSDLFPKLSAQIFNSPDNKEEFYLFNTVTNKGFSIDGFAADLCKKFNGEKTLAEIIKSFEKESNLTEGEYSSEINDLIQELEKNRLLVFLQEPDTASEK